MSDTKTDDRPTLFNDLRDKNFMPTTNKPLNDDKAKGNDDGDDDDVKIDESLVKELKVLTKRFADTQTYVKTLEGENKGFRDRISKLEGMFEAGKKPADSPAVTEESVMKEVEKRFGKSIRGAIKEMRDASDDGLSDLDDNQIRAAIMQGPEFQDRVAEVREELEAAAEKSSKGGDSKESQPKVDPQLDMRLSQIEKVLASLAGKNELDNIGDPDFDPQDSETQEIIGPLLKNGVPLPQAYEVWKANRIINGADDGDDLPAKQRRRTNTSPSRSKGKRQSGGGKQLTASEQELAEFGEKVRSRAGIPKEFWDKIK